MDAHSLRWALSGMKDHGDLERFISAIPRFIDSERHCYPEYTIGHLLEDPDVRLGWIIGRLLQTCASSSCALEQHIRKGRAIACMRAIWYITEKFASTDTLYWDSLFGAETADSLSILKKDFDADISVVAVCTAALAARSCLREFSHVLEWSRTKGPSWTNRARHLAGYIGNLSGGAVALPVEQLDIVARDGPLVTLGAFLNLPFNMKDQVDADVSFMINTTAKHLTDGVRPGEATPETQMYFSRLSVKGPYGDWSWTRYLDATATQSVRQIMDDLDHKEPAVSPGETTTEEDQAMFRTSWTIPRGPRHSCRSRWSSDSSKTAFSHGGDAASDATTSSLPVPVCARNRDEPPLTPVAEVPSLPSREENARNGEAGL